MENVIEANSAASGTPDSITRIAMEMRDRQMHNSFKSSTLAKWAERLDVLEQQAQREREAAADIVRRLRTATDEEFAAHADEWLEVFARALKGGSEIGSARRATQSRVMQQSADDAKETA